MEAFKLYRATFSSALQAKLEYRTDFVVGMVTSMMLQFAALSFLLVVFRNAPSLDGWNGKEVVFLFGMTAIALGACELFFNHIWLLPQYVVSGDLDRLLTYPVHSLPFFLVARPELHAFGNLLTGSGLVVGALISLDVAWYCWLFLPVWCVSGTLIYASLLVMFGSLSFKLVGPFATNLLIVHHLLQATRYPLGIYPGWLKYLLMIVMPFGTFHYLPAAWMFGRAALWVTLAAPIATLLVMVAAQWVWNWGLKHYESTGS